MQQFKSQQEEGEAIIHDIKQQILDLNKRRSKLRVPPPPSPSHDLTPQQVQYGLEDGLVSLGRMFRIYGREIRAT